jgi:glycosyltransferase involved in cell wall biosynthesis
MVYGVFDFILCLPLESPIFMRIALLTQQLNETALAHGYAALSKSLWDLGFKDQHILHLKNGQSRNIEFPPGVKIFKSTRSRIFFSPIWISRYLKQYRPDVIISMPVFVNIAAIMGKLLARENHTKIIISERAILSYYVDRKQLNNLRFKILPLLLKHLYPKADGLVVNNASVLQDLESNFQIRIEGIPKKVIHPAIDFETIKQMSEVQPDKEITELFDKPVVMSVGRLAKEKNFPLLINAFKIVVESIEARLLIFGDGPEREYLEKQIDQLGLDDAHLLGYVDNPWSIMKKSDVFVLPSQKEAFGRVLVEAMVCDLPIVATDAIGGGPKIILRDGECGSLVEKKNVEALAEEIKLLLTDMNLREEYINQGRKRYEDFAPSMIAQEWLSLIKDIQNN